MIAPSLFLAHRRIPTRPPHAVVYGHQQRRRRYQPTDTRNHRRRTVRRPIAWAISTRGHLADIGRIAESLSEQINGYDRSEARLSLTGMRKDIAYKAYLDAAASHDRNTLKAIGDWAGAEHPMP
jgi:hypothetical protein